MPTKPAIASQTYTPASTPISPGVYDKSALKRVEHLRRDQWTDKVEAGEIDRDILYMTPFYGTPIVIMSDTPTQDEIDAMAYGTLVFVYDEANPGVPRQVAVDG